MDATTKVAIWGVVGQVLVGAVSIFAIYRSPIVALNAQQRKEEAGDRRKRQFELFRTLMTFRATPLSVQFVQGLNSIDLEFDADIESETAIRNAWAALLDHFTNDKGKPDFIPTSQELIIKLLANMSAALGYKYDEEYIRRHSYYPMAHGSLEEQQNELRLLLLELLRGNHRLPIAVFEQKFPDLQIHPK
jgi:hypothetical protein